MSIIGDKAFKRFIDTGKISEKIMHLISLKIVKSIDLDEREKAVFYSKTGEINEILVKISKSQ